MPYVRIVEAAHTSCGAKKKISRKVAPTSDPVWKERAEQLMWLMVEPLTVKQLHKQAKHYFQMTPTIVTNALAWGDGIYFYFHPDDMKWRRYKHVKDMWP